jgi:hypothetical protein
VCILFLSLSLLRLLFDKEKKKNKKTNAPYFCPLNLSFSCPSICDDDEDDDGKKECIYIEEIFNYLPSI